MKEILTKEEIGELAIELQKNILEQEKKDKEGQFCRWVKYDEQFVGSWVEAKCCGKSYARNYEVPFECPHCGKQTIEVIDW